MEFVQKVKCQMYLTMAKIYFEIAFETSQLNTHIPGADFGL